MDTPTNFHDLRHLDHAKYVDDRKYARYTSHKANLSGATMLDMMNGPEGSIASTYHTAASRTPSLKLKRTSHASSNQAQLQQTNRTLVDIVHNVQSELSTQRQAMIDMQLRILQLEGALYTKNLELAQRTKNVPRKVVEEPLIKTAQRIDGSVQKPWENPTNRQTHAYELESPSNNNNNNNPEFWKSPTRFSGFNFNFDPLETVPQASVPQQMHNAPEVYHISRSAAPKLVRDARSKPSTPSGGSRVIPPPPRTVSLAETLDRTSMYHDAVSDIKEHVVEFEKVKIPFPPLLHSPPRTSRTKLVPSVSRDEELTALPQMPPAPPTPEPGPNSPPRARKGIKSMLIYRTISKSLKADAMYALERRSSR